jgi:hypothetical protein
MSPSTARGAAVDWQLHKFYRAGWIAATVAAGLLSMQLHGQVGALPPSEIKAIFLFDLAKFVEWPDAVFLDNREPITFGIVGADPIDRALTRAVSGQSIKGRSVTVRRYSFGDDLRSCQVLFVSASEQARLPQILSSVLGASVLTVSDIRRFAELGGVVQISVEEDRVQFSVNREAATQAKLQISAKLLTLSRVVTAPVHLGVK